MLMSRKVIVFGVDGLMMPLIKKFVAEGALPHIKRMLDGGAAGELLPNISAWGDVNWVAFLSGQSPGTSWLGQSQPTAYKDSGNLLEKLEQQGLRAALVHFPESISAPAPHFTLAPYWASAAPCPFTFATPAIFTTRYGERNAPRDPPQQTLGWPPSSPLAYHEKGLWQPIENHQLHIQSAHTDATPLSLRHSAGQLHIHYQQCAVELKRDEWSDWLPLGDVAEGGAVRFWLAAWQPETSLIEVIQSEITYPQRLGSDALVTQSLIDNFGPFFSQWAIKASPKEAYRASTLQDAEHQSLWMANSALHLTHDHGYALWIGVHHLVDESHHLCLGQYDPQSPFFRADEADAYVAVMRECYQVLDRSIGLILDHMDEQTTLLLASDHGDVPNEYMCDINRYLAQLGLVTYDAADKPLPQQSQVYLKDARGGLEIFINLKGRESQGVVAPAEFEQVRDKVIDALNHWQIDQRAAVAWVLRKEDAASIGYWGDEAGDVLFTYNTGFVWGTSREGSAICPVSAPGANHGPQKPSAETEHSANYGVLLAYGAGIRQNYYRDRQRLGPYRMIDPAATIATLLGVATERLDGTVMHDFLAPL